MLENKNTDVQEVFKSRTHVAEHDQRGGEFIHVEKIYLDPPSSPGDDALMIFNFRGCSELRAIKISANNRKELLESLETY